MTTAARFFVEDALGAMMSGGLVPATSGGHLRMDDLPASLENGESAADKNENDNNENDNNENGGVADLLDDWSAAAAARFELSPDRLTSALIDDTPEDDPVRLHQIAPERDEPVALAVAVHPSLRLDAELLALSIVRGASVLCHYDRTGSWPEAVESDLAMVAAGYAVPLARVVLRERGGTDGLWAGWTMGRAAAVNAQQIGYALALIERWGALIRPTDIKRLRLDARQTLRQATRSLSRHRRIWFDLASDNSIRRDPDEDLRSDVSTIRMGTIRALIDDPPASARRDAQLAAAVDDPDADVGDQAVLALRHSPHPDRHAAMIGKQIRSRRMDRSFAAISTAFRWGRPLGGSVSEIVAILKRDDAYSLALLPVIEQQHIDAPEITGRLCRLVAMADGMDRQTDASAYFATLSSLVDDPIAMVAERENHPVEPSRWTTDDRSSQDAEPLPATKAILQRHRTFLI